MAQAYRKARKHGHSRKGNQTPEYRAWCAMKSRCYRKTDTFYNDYGGRGIGVCSKWLNSFEAFFSDMGSKPTLKHTLDRIDNDGDYCPENCRWATQKQQAKNRRGNRFITHNRITLTIGEWAEQSGVNRITLHNRIKAGWPLGKALSIKHHGKAKLITFDGKTKSISQWERDLGLPIGCVKQRLGKCSWSVHKALTTPTGSRDGKSRGPWRNP